MQNCKTQIRQRLSDTVFVGELHDMRCYKRLEKFHAKVKNQSLHRTIATIYADNWRVESHATVLEVSRITDDFMRVREQDREMAPAEPLSYNPKQVTPRVPKNAAPRKGEEAYPQRTLELPQVPENM